MNSAPLTSQAIHEELERVRADFHTLVAAASPADLCRPSAGTRWTNGQLLFHMFFGYLVVRRLIPLVRLMGRLPEPVSRTFARVLEAGTRPFHTINYQSDRGAARVIHGRRLLGCLGGRHDGVGGGQCRRGALSALSAKATRSSALPRNGIRFAPA